MSPSPSDEVEVLSDQQFTEDCDWDIETARGKHETEEQWTLRRAFLIRNKGELPKLRLQCLSQVFVNMEFLGCKYPAETMAEVAELSVGILEDFRNTEKQEGKGAAQRTLVTASSAAQKKYSKGATAATAVRFVQATQPNMEIDTQRCSASPSTLPTEIDDNLSLLRPASPLTTSGAEGTEFKTIPSICTAECFPGLVLVEFLYLEESPLSLLKKSCEMCRVVHRFPKVEKVVPDRYRAEFSLGDPSNPAFFSELVSPDKDTVKLQLAVRVIRILKQHVYTIQIKEVATSDTEIGRSTVQNSGKIGSEDALDKSSNVGAKLMMLMGWTGGGLGKAQGGITQPIDTYDLIGRSRLGLGMDAGVTLGGMKKLLEREFKNADSTKEVVFSKEFTADEREVMHKAARHLNLKSTSYGVGEDRHLVIRRKVVFRDLVHELITSYNGETPKYRLIKPLAMR